MAVDSALGFVGTSGYFSIFILTLSIQPLMDSAIGQAGTFIIFGAINIFGSFWCYFKLKETSGGLTDKQKKNLYTPKDIQDMMRLASPTGIPSGSRSNSDLKDIEYID